MYFQIPLEMYRKISHITNITDLAQNVMRPSPQSKNISGPPIYTQKGTIDTGAISMFIPLSNQDFCYEYSAGCQLHVIRATVEILVQYPKLLFGLHRLSLKLLKFLPRICEK